jgi:hypothetical protein
VMQYSTWNEALVGHYEAHFCDIDALLSDFQILNFQMKYQAKAQDIGITKDFLI